MIRDLDNNTIQDLRNEEQRNNDLNKLTILEDGTNISKEEVWGDYL